MQNNMTYIHQIVNAKNDKQLCNSRMKLIFQFHFHTRHHRKPPSKVTKRNIAKNDYNFIID